MVVTFLGFVVAARAAMSAAGAFRLEADPVIMIERAEELVDALPAKKYVPGTRINMVDGNPSLQQGLVLRRKNSNDGASERPRILVEFRNVGRSPAIDVRVDIDVSVLISYRVGDALPAGFETDRRSAVDVRGTQHGSGVIELSAIAAQSSLVVSIENNIGLGVTLVPKPSGRQIRWRTKRRSDSHIAIFASEDFALHANDGTSREADDLGQRS